MTPFITQYLVAVNVITCLVYGIDKWKAKHARWRIPEMTLLSFAVIGGSIGAWCGMKLFHHKTQHKKFYIGVPFILILQLILAGYLYFYLLAV